MKNDFFVIRPSYKKKMAGLAGHRIVAESGNIPNKATMTMMTTMTTARRNARIDRRLSSRAMKRGEDEKGWKGWRTSRLLVDLSSRRRASWAAGRGSISDTPDRSLCRRGYVSSPSPCSRRSRPEIISTIPLFFPFLFFFNSRLRSERREYFDPIDENGKGRGDVQWARSAKG